MSEDLRGELAELSGTRRYFQDVLGESNEFFWSQSGESAAPGTGLGRFGTGKCDDKTLVEPCRKADIIRLVQEGIVRPKVGQGSGATDHHPRGVPGEFRGYPKAPYDGWPRNAVPGPPVMIHERDSCRTVLPALKFRFGNQLRRVFELTCMALQFPLGSSMSGRLRVEFGMRAKHRRGLVT
jgi:hypothetical protein